ncbi:DUF2895 family protein [Francisella sp. SYW-9]|uniref:DUF2895 family protein n=1 Tax=Francisella sp. SYW-9 TaxID=2610888 RepID=UPI00168CE804|nr:DUF2895 family protein [Francisella sp. SYW-9]
MSKPFFSALGNMKLALVICISCLVISMAFNVYLISKIVSYPDHMDIWQHNPDSTITLINPNEVQPIRLLNFVSQEWSKLNSWPNDGAVDSINNLKKDSLYLSPAFRNQFKRILINLNNKGYLKNYVVVTVPTSDKFNNNVKKVDGGWLVKQRFISRFYYNPPDSKDALSQQDITDTKVEYELEQEITFYVTKYPNSYGLALDRLYKTKIYTNKENI